MKLIGDAYVQVGSPTAGEAELLRQAGDWLRQTGPGGCPPEVLALLRAYVSDQVGQAVSVERKRAKAAELEHEKVRRFKSGE
jgi:hypothetical protein